MWVWIWLQVRLIPSDMDFHKLGVLFVAVLIRSAVLFWGLYQGPNFWKLPHEPWSKFLIGIL